MSAFLLVAAASIATSPTRNPMLEATHTGTVPLTPEHPQATRRFTVRLNSPSPITDAGTGTIRVTWLITEPPDAGVSDGGLDAGTSDGGVLADAGFDDLSVVARFTENAGRALPLLPGCSGTDCVQQFEVEFVMSGQRARPVDVQYVLDAQSSIAEAGGGTLTLTEP